MIKSETSNWQTNSFPRPPPHAPSYNHPFHYSCKLFATLAQKRLKTKFNWEDILIVFTQTKSFTDATFALLTLEVEEACKHTYETNTRTVLVLKNDDSEIDGLLHPIRFIK